MRFFRKQEMGDIMWDNLEDKLNKSGRKWLPSKDFLPYRCAELFCERCGSSLGVHDICCTNLESLMYCNKCVTKYTKNVPFDIPCGKVVIDDGAYVSLEYKNDFYGSIVVRKICYFNKKGRYIKVKGKRYYI